MTHHSLACCALFKSRSHNAKKDLLHRRKEVAMCYVEPGVGPAGFSESTAVTHLQEAVPVSEDAPRHLGVVVAGVVGVHPPMEQLLPDHNRKDAPGGDGDVVVQGDNEVVTALPARRVEKGEREREIGRQIEREGTRGRKLDSQARHRKTRARINTCIPKQNAGRVAFYQKPEWSYDPGRLREDEEEFFQAYGLDKQFLHPTRCIERSMNSAG